MKRKNQLIEFFCMLIAFVFFVLYYKEFINEAFSGITIVIGGIFTVSIVNAIKLIRLYIILYGKKFTGKDICFIYARTAIVNSIFPYKLGEIYRMYVIGTSLKNIQEGIIITFLDRLMDTIGLIIVMFFCLPFTNESISAYPVVPILLFCSVSGVIVYIVFPELSAFWKKYLLKNRASKHKLWGLEFISRLQLIYKDITQIVRGRGIMLIFTSILAWMIEIGSIIFFNEITNKHEETMLITKYLNSIMSGKNIVENARYTILSVILLIIICIICLFLNKEKKRESIGGI